MAVQIVLTNALKVRISHIVTLLVMTNVFLTKAIVRLLATAILGSEADIQVPTPTTVAMCAMSTPTVLRPTAATSPAMAWRPLS